MTVVSLLNAAIKDVDRRLMEAKEQEPLSKLEETLKGCNRVLILCGAGISVSSGIPGLCM